MWTTVRGGGGGRNKVLVKRLAWNKSIFNDFNNNRYSNQCLPAVNTLVIIFFLTILSLSLSLLHDVCLAIILLFA